MQPDSPESWWRMFQQGMLDGDVNAVLRLYEPGAAFAGPDGGVRNGHEEIREAIGMMASARADFRVTIEKTIHAGDLILMHSAWTLTRPRVMSGHALEVLRQQADGRWLLVIGEPEAFPV
jgi:ketosteroid isomerase-like protein